MHGKLTKYSKLDLYLRYSLIACFQQSSSGVLASDKTEGLINGTDAPYLTAISAIFSLSVDTTISSKTSHFCAWIMVCAINGIPFKSKIFLFLRPSELPYANMNATYFI